MPEEAAEVRAVPGLESWDGMGDRAKRRRARPPSARSRATEQRIHQAAAEIFREKGYASTSLQDIADSVGMLKSSLYYYIDSKDDLLYGLNRTMHKIAMENLKRVGEAPGPPSEKLRLLLTLHIAQFGKNLPLIRVFYTEFGALKGARRTSIIRDRRAYEAATTALIDEGKALGEFCPDLDSTLTCNAILTMANSEATKKALSSRKKTMPTKYRIASPPEGGDDAIVT